MERKIINDIFEWDVSNWSKGLEFWKNELENLSKKKVLTIGEKNAGLTLLFAQNGAHVTSTDLDGVTEEGKEKIKRFGMEERVTYDSADFTKLKFKDNSFDVIAFKSVLGELHTKERQKIAISEAARVLKKNGVLIFAENMIASSAHTFLRRKFLKWGNYWRYLDYSELNELFEPFNEKGFYFHGFLGALGRTEKQRSFLSLIDKFIAPIIPNNKKYIIFGVCKKSDN